MTSSRTAALLIACCFSAGVSAAAADYPNKPIRLIVPFAPGGTTDHVARFYAQAIGPLMRTTIVVDNRGGAGGLVGHEAAVRAAPDGYTLAFTASSYATNAALHRLPYHPIDDITPIGLAAYSAYAVVAHPSVPVNSIADLIAHAREGGGTLNYGTSGVGGQAHLLMEYFLMTAGIRMTHVPYRGAGPAMVSLLAGNTQVMLLGTGLTLPQMRAKRIRAFAVTSPKRWPGLPDLPSLTELVPGYEGSLLWFGMLGPAKLPQEVVRRWSEAIHAVGIRPESKELLANRGSIALTATPAEFRKTLQADIARWTKVVQQARITPQAGE